MSASIPQRAVYRSQEVCEIADVQPYVLKSWEAEFPELGVAKSADGPRIYRRPDVELVLKLKHMLLVDGLTLAGARRRLSEEGIELASERDEESISDSDVAVMLDRHVKKGLRDVREGLGFVLGVLDRKGAPARSAGRAARPGKPAKKAKPAKSKVVRSSKSRPAKSTRSQSARGRKSTSRKRR